MIPRLDEDGRLIPPNSRTEGVERIRQLRHEAAKIDGQLAGPTRMTDLKEIMRWRARASRKVNQFRTEEMQLSAWLAGWKAATDEGDSLLVRAHALLAELELRLDFDGEQEALMNELEDRCLPEIIKRESMQ